MTAIPTRFGNLVVSLAGGSWLHRGPSPGPVELSFDPDIDGPASLGLLSVTRRLAFRVEAPDLVKRATPKQIGRQRFIVYLGRDLESWDNDLALVLRPKSEAGSIVWTAPEGNVKDFSARHWCAAQAALTLCQSPGVPILDRRSRKPLQTRISLGYSDAWYASLYRETCRSLEETGSASDITSSFHELRLIAQKARVESEGSAALELFYRLRSAVHPYLGALAQVSARPLRQPLRTATVYQLTPADATRFFADRTGDVEVVDVARAAPFRGRAVPIHFRGVSHLLSTDNAANRYAARSVTTVDAWLQEVGRAIQAFIESERESIREFERTEGKVRTAPRTGMLQRREEGIRRHESALLGLERTRAELLCHASRLPVGQRPLGHGELDAPALNFDPRYAELRRQLRRLSRAIQFVDSSPESTPYEVEPFNKLYERWCFIQVVDALLALGFQFANTTGRRTTPFYHHPVPHQVNCVLSHPALPGARLDVWYERRYPLYDPTAGHMYGVETRVNEGRTEYHRVDPSLGGRPELAKRTPDIALEIFRAGERVPTIITLDPTLAAHTREDKYEYRDSIRSLVEGDVEPGGHESRRIVGAAWAIHPGSQHDREHLAHRKAKCPDWKGGVLCLRPEARSVAALRDSLGGLLEAVLSMKPASLRSCLAKSS